MNKTAGIKHPSNTGRKIPAMRGRKVSAAIVKILESRGDNFKETGNRLVVYNGEKNISVSKGKGNIQAPDISKIIKSLGITLDELLDNT